MIPLGSFRLWELGVRALTLQHVRSGFQGVGFCVEAFSFGIQLVVCFMCSMVAVLGPRCWDPED